ncbi:restriction endonuclease subunit S [Kiloniella sp.]|uniref:restriction endonuclease subunit S n=1 Tax=Kiloniella sp. TaxID=1938587 RepID=UPI003A917B77
MSFDLTTLGAFAKVQGGYAYKSQDFSKAGNCPVLKIKNIRFGYVDYSETAYINDELADETTDWRTTEGDILISMTGSGPNAPKSLVGRTARVWKNDPTSWINQRVGKIVIKDEKSIHLDYIFYLLTTPQSQEFLVSNSSGSANQANISGKTIEALPCPNVSFKESERIAKILRDIDEKIISNRQINQTLEEMAQAIFKSWFVDFDPTRAKVAALGSGGSAEDAERAAMRAISGKSDEELSEFKAASPDAFNTIKSTAALFPATLQDSELGEIPVGWLPSDLKSYTTELRRGISPKYTRENGVRVINQKCIRNHTIDFTLTRRNDPSKRKIEGREIEVGDVLVNSTGVGTLGRLSPVRNLDEITVVDSHVTVVRADSLKISKSFLAGLMIENEPYIEASGAGSTGQTELRKQILEDIHFVCPTHDIDRKFDAQVEKINSLIAILEAQSLSLAETRDTLLPKLLSGEMDLSNIAATDEEVA